MARLKHKNSYIATIYDAGENSLEINLLGDITESIGEVISCFGENYIIGQVTGFGSLNTSSWSLQEFSLAANFVACYPCLECALLLLEVIQPVDCWDLINWRYVGQFSCKKDIAKEILRGRFNATERLIDCVDLNQYLDSLLKDGGIVLIDKSPFLHCFTYYDPFW